MEHRPSGRAEANFQARDLANVPDSGHNNNRNHSGPASLLQGRGSAVKVSRASSNVPLNSARASNNVPGSHAPLSSVQKDAELRTAANREQTRMNAKKRSSLPRIALGCLVPARRSG